MPTGRSFVGFGFGPIQSGLFTYEAFKTGRFDRLSVAEVDAGLVGHVNDGNGCFSINIAAPDGITSRTVSGVRMLNPRVRADRAELVSLIREADELATALPAVAFYDRGDDSVVALLADAIVDNARPQLLYAAENDNHAAEILIAALHRRVDPDRTRQLQVVNTVIGKMSGVIRDADEIRRLGLAPLTPGSDRAVLVEAFNRILISQVRLPGFGRGIDAFVEKPALLPFEEAKLYGHNAVHALIGYLARLAGLPAMSDVIRRPAILALAREAFVNESGRALVRRYGSLGDLLFTDAGFAAYADELLTRMTNPYLNDRVERVTRDPVRKIAPNDRLFGTMKLCFAEGVTPRIFAVAASAAIRCHTGSSPSSRTELSKLLSDAWSRPIEPSDRPLIDLTWEAADRLDQVLDAPP